MQRVSNGSCASSSESVKPKQLIQTTLDFPLPAGMKRRSDLADLPDRSEAEDDEDDSSDEDSYSESSNDSEFVPPPRSRGAGARGADGGLRAAPKHAEPRYWDHENHAAACAAEAQEMANAGVTWADIDASEGESDCDVESEEDEEDEPARHGTDIIDDDDSEESSSEDSDDESAAMTGRCAKRARGGTVCE